jgi:hypothetical protein
MNRHAIAVSSLLLVSCAHTGESPLIFGQSNTLGLSIGGSAADQGGDLVIGYKGQNFALVPVTMAQPGGGTAPLNAVVDKDVDAYSVLGQFETNAKAGATAQKAGLGTFFATGLAAKRLADGFAQKMGDHKFDRDCNPKPAPKPYTEEELKKLDQQALITKSLNDLAKKQADQAKDLKEQVQAHEDKIQKLQAQAAPASGAQPERKPNNVLMYAQYNSLGFIVSASGTQQGADLTLGYKDRNLAIVPSVHRNADGIAEPRYSIGTQGTHKDSLSVLGQFDFAGGNDNSTVDATLGKFFSTGIAARRLGDGFHAKLCAQYEAPKNPAPQAQDKDKAKVE